MINISKLTRFTCIGMLSAIVLTACSDQDDDANGLGELTPEEQAFGKATGNFTAEEWYPGGALGTTEKASYSAPTPAVTNITGMEDEFIVGEGFFEKLYTFEQEPRKGLGPAWVRNSCIACHPSYGHGRRQTEYRANQIGNGYLLVIYHPDTNGYITEVTGMPQTQAMSPFKAPIDENQISIEWKNVTAMESGLPMQFEDGEAYSLIYPEVHIPQTAFNTNPKPTNYEVRLESTIGIYGTGLTDAIPDDSITAQWLAESKYFNSIGRTDALNPAMWDQTTDTWKSYYTNTLQGDGTKYVRRYTYAMSRGPILDAAGANAIWNITNVNRSDRRYHYLDLAGVYYAKKSSQDPEVQAGFTEYINRIDPTNAHPEWHTGNLEKDIYTYLTSKQLDAEMTDAQYRNLMVWHRGLAVPAARNTATNDFKAGKQLFSQLGCAACHRPSWQTGEDHIQDPAKFFTADSDMPRYPRQKIWPYTDFVQHRLWMKNDIRTGWCRTTPLWGRGLAAKCGSGVERLHDCRARNVMEAIMWHGCKNEGGTSDAYNSVVKFRNLSKEERDQVIYFLESI